QDDELVMWLQAELLTDLPKDHHFVAFTANARQVRMDDLVMRRLVPQDETSGSSRGRKEP
ncbi:MAG: hypothetical protein L6300_10200, partial [Syntrophaceae bacterium]|nr:hypothetical protein [Syntrophaceae bacterium]